MAEEVNVYKYYENKSYPVESGLYVGDTNNKKKFKHEHSEMDIQVGDLKQALHGWKEIILPVNSILNWEKQWHPFSIIGSSTMFFMILWLMDPSVLTAFSLIGLTLTLSDFLVPHISSTLLKSMPWSEKQEEKFDRICRSLIISKEKFIITCRSFYLMKTTRPNLYYGISIMILLALAWIGNNVHNLLLIYVVLTFICLMPGMERRGMLRKYGTLISEKIADMATNSKINANELKKDK